jgi:hypothetical protein
MMTTPDLPELCRRFGELPVGTIVRFDEGVDFTTKAVSFRNKLHREMRTDGFVVQSVVRGTSVYAKVKRVIGDAKPAEGVATRSEPEGPVVSYIVPGPTNPMVPAALFRVPK